MYKAQHMKIYFKSMESRKCTSMSLPTWGREVKYAKTDVACLYNA